jgi:hypothetical protein
MVAVLLCLDEGRTAPENNDFPNRQEQNKEYRYPCFYLFLFLETYQI